jgi:alkylated DNA repair dioxygenase AlkB
MLEEIFHKIEPKPPIISDTSMISGLTYIPNYLSQEEVKEFLNNIRSSEWLTDLKRRVQHYGYKYDYRSRSIDSSMFLGELPHWAKKLAVKLHNDGFSEFISDQLIVNEYLPGQGISNHIDCEPCFGETIMSISLGSYCVMDFINKTTQKSVPVFLECGSLVVLKGDARYKWTHGIAPRKADIFNGIKTIRGIRTSMTFRKTII